MRLLALFLVAAPVDFERDPGIRMRMFARENKPYYKPEYWERVQFNDVNGHSLLAPDPACVDISAADFVALAARLGC